MKKEEKSLSAMQSALVHAGVTTEKFRKFKHRVPRQRIAPLVIETRCRFKSGAKRIKAASRVQKVIGTGILNGNKVVRTAGGDIWKYEDLGNNYLRSIE